MLQHSPAISRRKFFKLSVALFMLSVTSLFGFETSIATQEQALLIQRDGKTYNITFIDENGSVIEEVYLQLCHIFKDSEADVAVKMDINLFTILSNAQKWLTRYDYVKPYIITSAYRTPHTNANTEGAALNSLHMYGKAVDLKCFGLSSSYMASLFRSFGATGIGIYPTFVHIDTWNKRMWRG